MVGWLSACDKSGKYVFPLCLCLLLLWRFLGVTEFSVLSLLTFGLCIIVRMAFLLLNLRVGGVVLMNFPSSTDEFSKECGPVLPCQGERSHPESTAGFCFVLLSVLT